ncbi:MAG: lytic transglycosylase domain-containing protein [Magnetococcales bacterium]|nr:lytic transglycosylase domain-containing protein [Magnetococcales bacterium]
MGETHLANVATDAHLQPGSAPGLAPLSNAEMSWLAEGFQQMAMARGVATTTSVQNQVGPVAGKAPGLAKLSKPEQAFLASEYRSLELAKGQGTRTGQRLTAARPMPQTHDPATIDALYQRLVREGMTPSQSTPYDQLIARAAQKNDLDPKLLRAVVQVESGFNPKAVSPAGAQGLMQLMPDTAEELGVTDPFNPEQNIMAGARYLKQLLDRYQGNRNAALAAYNWGMGNVDSRSEPLPRETRNYISRVNQLLKTHTA